MLLPIFNDARGQYILLKEKVDNMPLLQRARIRAIELREKIDRSHLLGNARFRVLAAFLTLLLVWLISAAVFANHHDPPPAAQAPPPPPPPPPPKVLPPVPMVEISKMIRETHAVPATGPGNYTNGAFFDAAKVAVIIEDRPLENLIPLIIHFSAVLGPSWPIVLFTSLTSIHDSAALRRHLSSERVIIRSLPAGLKFETHFDVSVFLTEPWFWEQLAPAKNVLLFQTDSIICGNSPLSVDDFLQYDLIGAPIQEEWHGRGYNGGLSLRNRALVLDIIAHDTKTHPLNATAELDIDKYEDQWFYMRMLDHKANLPSEEIAKTFSVQTLFYEFPVGYHQPEKFQKENMTLIEQWCPEVKLVTDKLLKCEPPIC